MKDGKLSLDEDGFTTAGEWEWEENKESIEITYTQESESWKVLKLTKDDFWFEDENKFLWECKSK